MNNLPKVVTQQRRGRASNPRLLDRKSDALPLSHRATANELLSRLFGNLSQPAFLIFKFDYISIRCKRHVTAFCLQLLKGAFTHTCTALVKVLLECIDFSGSRAAHV